MIAARAAAAVLFGKSPIHVGHAVRSQDGVALRIEWDPQKAKVNVLRHGVDFDEAETVFGDPLSKTVDDPEHSVSETRFATTGMSDAGRLLVVVHADRGDTIRIISARTITAAERRTYEEEDSS